MSATGMSEQCKAAEHWDCPLTSEGCSCYHHLEDEFRDEYDKDEMMESDGDDN